MVVSGGGMFISDGWMGNDLGLVLVLVLVLPQAEGARRVHT